MSDLWNDSRQEYEGIEGSTTTNIINGGTIDILTPVENSDANNLIQLVNANNVSQLYIIQANASGEIRFLTLDAKNNNNQGGNLLYNTKIGADGKLYYYHSYNILVNPLKSSGWYEVGLNIAEIEKDNIARDAYIAGQIPAFAALVADVLVVQEDLQILTIDTSAVDVNHEARITNLEYHAGSGWNVDMIRASANTRDEGLTVSQSLFEIIYADGFTPDIVAAATRSRLTSQLGSILYSVVSNSLEGIGGIGLVAGIIYGIYKAADDKKKEVYNDELLALNDTLQEAPVSTTQAYLIHTGLSIISGNNGFTTSGTYRVTVQREAVIIIFVNSSLIASVVNVEQFGTSTFNIGESILIAKSLLGGGTGDDLELEVVSLGTFKAWTEARSAYIITKINGIDTKQRRKEGVIGADDIDTSQFTTTNVTYTDTTDTTFNETITYKQLKSRLNLLPTGTSDVDVYTSTGKVGIGTTPSSSLGIHIYNAYDSGIRLQSGTSGISSIQFIRGIEEDNLVDFRLVNDTNLFRLQHQVIIGGNATQFGDGNSFLMDISTTKTQFYKDLHVLGKVGINTTPHATINLDVNGTTRFMDNVAIGTTPPNGGDFFQPQLKVYSTGDTTLYLRGGASYSSSVEFGRGNREDASLDFRIVNKVGENGLLFQFQDDLITYDNIESELMLLKPSGANFFTSFSVAHNVGIGTDADLYSTNRLLVDGTTKIINGDLYLPDGRIGIGTLDPNTPLHIQSTTGDTRLTIEDMDTTANGYPTNIEFPDGGYTSTAVAGTTTDLFVYLINNLLTTSKSIRFTVKQRMEMELLMVGGGGAGGHYNGGGGGAGGIFYGYNIILEAGNYVMVVGKGGVGQQGADTQRLPTADGEPTMLCYDDGFLTPVKFNLGGVIHNAVAFGGGSGATNNAVPPKLTGWNGGSGGGSTESVTNSYALNAAGTPTQGATFWNGTSYVVGGTDGRTNTTTANDGWSGGGGGGTASTPATTSDNTCGKNTQTINFAGTNYYLAAGGGGVAITTTEDLSATVGLGGVNTGGSVIGGYGQYRITSTNQTFSPTNGVVRTGSGGGGAGIGGIFHKAGDGGTGIAMIRYRIKERLNSCSVDFFRNQSVLTGYSVGNYEGQFKVYKDGIIIPSILINPLGNVAIKSRYNATSIFQVGEKGGRLRIANDDTDITQIGTSDECLTTPNIKLFGASRTSKPGNIEYTCGSTSQHIFSGGSMVVPPISGNITASGDIIATGYVKSSYVAFHAGRTSGPSGIVPNTIINGDFLTGFDNIIIANSAWNATTGYFTCPVAGIYSVYVSAWTSIFTGGIGFTIRKNATTSTNGVKYGGSASPTAHTAISTSVIINCAVNDTISIWSNSIGLTIEGGYNSFSIYLQTPL